MTEAKDVPVTRCATRTQSRLVPGPHGCTRETVTIPLVDRPATEKPTTR
jgi:hypothetical protein